MSIFDTSYLGVADNQVTFNSYATFPIFRVISRAPQARQLRDLDIPVPFEGGIADFETLIGKTVYVIAGKMYPASEADYSTGLAALRKLANLDFEQRDTSSDLGYVPYVYSENGTNTRQVFLKVLYVDIPESTRNGLVQPFRLVCKIKDPTIYGYPSKSASTQGTNPTSGGGAATFPFAFPVVFGASTVSVTSTATNNGTVAAYPASITIVGPINTPRVTNSKTGEYIEVAQNLASSANVLTITYTKTSVSVTLDGNSVLGSVSAASTYFRLQPGANPIVLSGSSVGSNCYVTVNYYDSYALS